MVVHSGTNDIMTEFVADGEITFTDLNQAM